MLEDPWADLLFERRLKPKADHSTLDDEEFSDSLVAQVSSESQYHDR
jgi:hypothetical protein